MKIDELYLQWLTQPCMSQHPQKNCTRVAQGLNRKSIKRWIEERFSVSFWTFIVSCCITDGRLFCQTKINANFGCKIALIFFKRNFENLNDILTHPDLLKRFFPPKLVIESTRGLKIERYILLWIWRIWKPLM